MKTLILYCTNQGNTERYARDIASAVGGDVLKMSRWNLRKAKDYDCVVFGGWVRGGIIQGLDDFLAEYDSLEGKDILIYSVGISVPTKQGRADMISRNLLDMYHVRYYQFRGSFDFKKLRFPQNILMKRSVEMSIKDPSISPESDPSSLRALLENPIEFYDQEKVDRVVSVIRTLEKEQEAVSEA